MAVKPGYKQTEVGVIPEEWELKDFDTLANVIDGDRGTQYPGSSDFSESGHCLFLNAGNVTKEGFKFEECAFITREKDAALNKGKLKRDDIVLTTRGTIGNWAHFNAAVPFENMRINSGMVILRNTSALLDTGYLYALLQSRLVDLQIERLTFGSAQPQLTVRDINKFEVVVPPLPEQRAIAEALSDVDGLLGGLDRLIAKKRDLKQAAMQQLLTGQTRLPGFHGEWEVKRLGDVVEIRKGQLITSDTTSHGDIPVIAGGKQPAYYHDVANRQGRTITISASGASAGYVALYNTPIFASDCSTISEGRSYSLDFIFYQLLLKQQLIYKAQTGGAQPHIHAVDLMPIEVTVPPLPEQTAIAEVLSELDAELAVLEQRQAKTRALKQGMMQELLTGRIRLV